MEDFGFDGFDSSSSSSWEDIDEEEDQNGGNDEPETCHPLLLNSLILEKILDFIPAKELIPCRLVCKEWNRTALLKSLLGSKYEAVVTNSNWDELLQVGSTSTEPFCNKFYFHNVYLYEEVVDQFCSAFGEKLISLSLNYCTVGSSIAMAKILKCPRLESLSIHGSVPLPEEDTLANHSFTELRSLKLSSASTFSNLEASDGFIKTIVNRAHNLQSISVSDASTIWRNLSRTMSTKGPLACSKLTEICLNKIDEALQLEHFQDLIPKCSLLKRVQFRDCLVTSDFLEDFLQLRNFKTLTTLEIEGAQDYILSRAISSVTLPNLSKLSLPIDGISLSESSIILQSLPKLRTVKILGLLQTCYTFQEGKLDSLRICELRGRLFRSVFLRGEEHNLSSHAIIEEFLKILHIFQVQPRKVQVALTISKINSACIREIISSFPDLEEFTFSAYYCAKDCIVSFTGIPWKICKQMAAAKSFSVLEQSQAKLYHNTASSLKKLKSLEISLSISNVSQEMALLFIVYGVSEISSLKQLTLNNFTLSDVAFMTLAQNLNLTSCNINKSEKDWLQFQTFFQKHSIKSFLLPPPPRESLLEPPERSPGAAGLVGKNRKFLLKIFDSLTSHEIFESRMVCKYWRALSWEYLHKNCSAESKKFACNLEHRLTQVMGEDCRGMSPSKPCYRFLKYFEDSGNWVPPLERILKLMENLEREYRLVILSMSRRALEFFQRDNCQPKGKRLVSCEKRRQLEYWHYPDGKDELIYRPNRIECHTGEASSASGVSGEVDFDISRISEDLETIIVIGCFGRKDDALLEFINPLWNINAIHLIGLEKPCFDLVLPRLTSMSNLETLEIKPFLNSEYYSELSKTHLQILCNASFKLRECSMHLHDPSDALVEFVRSQRFTLQTVELRSNVNISDKLTFLMPQLRSLQLDEPPGCLLWTTLNVHSSLETINFGRSGQSNYPVKNKSTPKVTPLEPDFSHAATELLCDLNWFLENATCSRRTGQHHKKSILQQGSDSALKFFTHFPFLSSLTLRSVHAHYGILQGIFKKFTLLKKLQLVNATGVTDEILTGFSQEVLDEMDILNPFQIMGSGKPEVEKRRLSIRNLKCLTHLSLDDQPGCTDFSIIFGILRLQNLKYLSCGKWNITDVALRALADILPSLQEVYTKGCPTVSKFAREYFYESRCLNRAQIFGLGRVEATGAGCSSTSSTHSTPTKSSLSHISQKSPSQSHSESSQYGLEE